MALTDTQMREIAHIAADHGLSIFGQHRLLVAPEGPDGLES